MSVLMITTGGVIFILLVMAIKNWLWFLTLAPFKTEKKDTQHRPPRKQLFIQELEELVELYYRDIAARCELMIGVSPSIGLFFTIMGLIAVMIKQSNGVVDHGQMLGAMGVALLSTAFSSIALISQIILRIKIQVRQSDDYHRIKQQIKATS